MNDNAVSHGEVRGFGGFVFLAASKQIDGRTDEPDFHGFSFGGFHDHGIGVYFFKQTPNVFFFAVSEAGSDN